MRTRDNLTYEERRRIAALLASYGADPRRWPESDRTRYAALLATYDPTEIAMEAATDALLDEATAPPLPDGATDRLLARAWATPRATLQPILPARRLFLAPAAALAASLLLGLWIGAAGRADGLLLDTHADHEWNAIGLQSTDEGDAT